jgi:hypothetical protein
MTDNSTAPEQVYIGYIACSHGELNRRIEAKAEELRAVYRLGVPLPDVTPAQHRTAFLNALAWSIENAKRRYTTARGELDARTMDIALVDWRACERVQGDVLREVS